MQLGRIAAVTVLALLSFFSCTPRATIGATASASNVICPPGAGPDHGRCTCRPDLRLLAGACVAPRVVAEHCGPASLVTAVGCEPRTPCERGRARDLDSGECLARRDVRALAVSLGILVADDQVLGCPSDGELVFAGPGSGGGGPRLACLSPTPIAGEPCFPGSIATAANGCARVIEPAGARGEVRVDVVRWVQGVFGAEGGAGAPLLCRPLARSPAALSGARGATKLSISLVFPDNDVSQVVAELHVVSPSGAPNPDATADLERAAQPLIEALRSLGGTASEASISTLVRCEGENGEDSGRNRPIPENDVGR